MIKPKWHKIIQAFQKAFVATASSIAAAFNDIKMNASKKSAEEDAENDKT